MSHSYPLYEAEESIWSMERKLLDLETRVDVMLACQSIAACSGFFSQEFGEKIYQHEKEIQTLKEKISKHQPIEGEKMPIKVEVASKLKKVDEYPCIKRHSPSGAIVLLTSPSEGTVLSPLVGVVNENDPLGQVCLGYRISQWRKEEFIPWSGLVTLEQ